MTLVEISNGIGLAAQQFEQAIQAASEMDAGSAAEGVRRMKAAREWAKLQDDARHLAERLTWLEALMLRRIGVLGCSEVLNHQLRRVAVHFAGMDEPELAAFLHEFPGSTALSSYRLYLAADKVADERARGRRVGGGSPRVREFDGSALKDDLHRAIPPHKEGSTSERAAITEAWMFYEHIGTVRSAAAVLMDDIATRSSRFTISDVVDEFIDENLAESSLMPPWVFDGFRKGLREAVREALVTAPPERTNDDWSGIPAFITVHDDVSGQWVRVPSEFATVGDARNMIRLREAHLEVQRRALDNLISDLKVGSQFRTDEEWLRSDEEALLRREAREKQWGAA